MKRTTRLATSIASGIVAAVIAVLYASSVRAQADRERVEALARYGGELVSVCVATRDIEPGETIDEANVSVEEWVAGLLPASAATSVSEVRGKVATSRIPSRAVICPVYLEVRESSVEMPAGMVAVSVASDAEHAVGGAIERGQTVDVYVSRDAVADRLTAARVLDTSALADGGGQLSWVTLGVRTDAVQELLAATTRGMVTLAIPAKAAGSRDDRDG